TAGTRPTRAITAGAVQAFAWRIAGRHGHSIREVSGSTVLKRGDTAGGPVGFSCATCAVRLRISDDTELGDTNNKAGRHEVANNNGWSTTTPTTPDFSTTSSTSPAPAQSKPDADVATSVSLADS